MPGGVTRLREEVRDDSHDNNRCGGNRCGVAPTATPLRAHAGPGLLIGAPVLCRGTLRVQQIDVGFMVSEKRRPRMRGAAFLLRWSPNRERRAPEIAQGTVKWFNDDKGYGFITPDEGGEDLFVHHTGIAGNGFKSLDEGAKVSYEATQWSRGMQAE